MCSLWMLASAGKLRSELGSRALRYRVSDSTFAACPLSGARVALADTTLVDMMCRPVWAACCCILVRLPSAAAAASAGTDHHGHHSPPPPAPLTLLPAPPAAPHREHNGHDVGHEGHEGHGHEGHKVHSEGRHEERPGHGGAEGQAGDALDDGGDADDSAVQEEAEEWSLLQELSEETTQPGFDGLTILLILAAFAGAFMYFVWLERGQAPPMYPMGVGRATQKGVHARIPTS